MDPANIPLPESPSPYRIPLPPSPTIASIGLGPAPRPPTTAVLAHQRVPSRKPEGWVSTLPRSLSARASDTIDEPRTGTPNAKRVVSGLQLGEGRKVSGALQYALLPSPNSPLSIFTDLPESPSSSTTTCALEGDDDELAENSVTQEAETPIDWDEVHDLTHDLVDPEWMSYVRAQLAALFPDFGGDAYPPSLEESPTPPNLLRSRPSALTLRENDQMPRMVSDASTLSSTSLQTPPTATSIGHMVLHTQQIAARSAVEQVEQATREDGRGSMREELSAMREEMERLRSFVGDLAGGLSVQREDRGVDANTRLPSGLQSGETLAPPEENKSGIPPGCTAVCSIEESSDLSESWSLRGYHPASTLCHVRSGCLRGKRRGDLFDLEFGEHAGRAPRQCRTSILYHRHQ